MVVDKVNNASIGQQVTNERLSDIAHKKGRAIKQEQDVQENQNAETVQISPQAKKLQETESILRFALQKLDDLDELRQEKLQDVQKKIDKNYYFTEQFNQDLAESIIPDSEIDSIILKKAQIENYTQKLNKMDQNVEKTDQDKLSEISNKISNGYYDNINVNDVVADTLTDILTQ